MIEYKSELVKLAVIISDYEVNIIGFQIAASRYPEDSMRIERIIDSDLASCYEFLNVKDWEELSHEEDGDSLWYVEGYYSSQESEPIADDVEPTEENDFFRWKFEITERKPLDLKTYITHWVIPFATEDAQMLLLAATDCLQSIATLTRSIDQLGENASPLARTLACVLSINIARITTFKGDPRSLRICSTYADKTPED